MRTQAFHQRVVLGSLLVLLPGCVQRAPAELAGDTDPKLSISSYIEEGNLVGLVAASKLTRVRAERDVVPVEVAVANIGLAQLTLTSESFTLVGPNGERYPVATPEELKRYGSTDADRQLVELPPVVRSKWNNYQIFRMNFTRSFDEPTVTDPLLMPRFRYGLDVLYFPRPAGGVRGRTFELHMTAPELPDPVFVKFAVAP